MPIRTSTRTASVAVASTLLLGAVPAVVLAPAAGAATPTTLTVRTNQTSFVAGQPIVIAADLSIKKAGVPITYYEVRPGQAARVIFHGTTNAQGKDAIEGKANYNATYVVRYNGSANYEPARGQRTVGVDVRMGARLGGGYRTSGSYRVYHAGTKGVFAVDVAPSKAGKKLVFVFQVASGSSWKTIDRSTYTINSSNTAAATFRGVAGRKYRLQATWTGDSLNTPAHTAYKYVTFTS